MLNLVKIFLSLLFLFPSSSIANNISQKRSFDVFVKVPLMPKIEVMEINTNLEKNKESFFYSFKIQSKKIVEFINPVNGEGEVRGSIEDIYKPSEYKYDYIRKNKKRMVQIIYDGPRIKKVTVEPDYNKSELSPITGDMLLDTIDPSTFFLNVLELENLKDCNFTFRVFDGKRRYDIQFFQKLENEEKDTITCKAKQIKLGGYKKKETDVFASSETIDVIYKLNNDNNFKFYGYRAVNGNINIIINENH